MEGVPLLGFGLAGGWGQGGNYVRNTRIPCILHSFLVVQISAKKPRLRRPLETMLVLQCFLRQEGRMYWYLQYFVDAGYEPFFFFDEVVLVQFARKKFLHERLLYLPERSNSSV